MNDMIDALNFDYSTLPSFSDFRELSHAQHYQELSSDWWVIITDIQGSTQAIQEGRYKDVNLIGAASIMALLNAVRPLEIPYVFGGDGATICVPDAYIEIVKPALRAAKRMAEQQFNLGLRLGVVSVSTLQEAGKHIRIAKFQASENYAQAMFDGNGLSYAETLVKNPNDTQYCLSDDPSDPCAGDFSGLECRWQNIHSPKGEMHSILVSARGQSASENQHTYERILQHLDSIYPDEANRSPVTDRHLKLSTDKKQLASEIKIKMFADKNAGQSSLARRSIALSQASHSSDAKEQKKSLSQQLKLSRFARKLPWLIRVGRLLMAFKIGHWRHYRKDVIANTDYRKFDEMLRMVLAGSATQRQQLEAYLIAEHAAGHIFYGLHHSESALMTCVIFQYHNNHVHFIDGADGGYAIAAKGLKAQMKA